MTGSRSEVSSVVQKESFCEADVVPRQVILKIPKCPGNLDSKSLSDKLTAVARQMSDTDERIAATQLDSNCRFLAESSTRTVSQLITFFQSFILKDKQTQILLDKNALNDFAVEYVEPNFKIYLEDHSSPDPGQRAVPDPWWFSDEFPGAGAVQAWKKYGQGSNEVVVAVLDTGIYSDHPALSANTWKAPRSFNIKLGKTVVQCEKNTIGFNSTTTDPNRMCIPEDDTGHGTHVAGIIQALNHAPKAANDVSSNVKVMALKIFDKNSTTVDKIITALEFALRIKTEFGKKADVRVLNNSYTLFLKCGDDPVKNLRGKIEQANQQGMLFVAAAGERGRAFSDDPINNNDINPRYPASFYPLPNVISVTAIDSKGSLVETSGEYSNFGKASVLIGAPGAAILSTDLLGNGGGYNQRSGTSMAAPFVSGAAAWLLAVTGCSDLSPGNVKENILKRAAPTPALVGITASNGRLNIYGAIELCAK